MTDVDFSYSWFKETCEEYELPLDSYLPLGSLILAYECAKSMKRISGELAGRPKGELRDNLEALYKMQDEQRVKHMLEALNLAQFAVSLPPEWERWAIEEQRKNEANTTQKLYWR